MHLSRRFGRESSSQGSPNKEAAIPVGEGRERSAHSTNPEQRRSSSDAKQTTLVYTASGRGRATSTAAVNLIEKLNYNKIHCHRLKGRGQP